MTKQQMWSNHYRTHIKPFVEWLEGVRSTLSTGVVLSNGKPVGICVIATNKAGVKTVRAHIGDAS